MTKISHMPAGNAHHAHKAHGHAPKPASGKSGAQTPFNALLALLNPSDPTDGAALLPADQPDGDAPAISAADAKGKTAGAQTAPLTHDRDWKSDKSTPRDHTELPGGGGLLPMPIIITHLVQAQAPTTGAQGTPTGATQPAVGRVAMAPLAQSPVMQAAHLAQLGQPTLPGQPVQSGQAAPTNVLAQPDAFATATIGAAQHGASATSQRDPDATNGMAPTNVTLPFAKAAPDAAPRGYAPDVRDLSPAPQMGSASTGNKQTPTVNPAPQRQHVFETKDDHQTAFAKAEPVSSVGVVAPVTAQTRGVDIIATAPSTPPMQGHPGIISAGHQIAMQAQLVQQGQRAEMRLRLRPPELGEVRVTMRRDDAGKLSVHLIPATHEGEAALKANLHHLRAALDQHAPNQGADVALGQRDASQHDRHSQRQADSFADFAPTSLTASASLRGPASNVPRARVARSGLDYDA